MAKSRNKKRCFHCEVNGKNNVKIIGIDYKMVAIERPYINLFFHKKCYENIENMEIYLQKYFKVWYNSL